MPCLVMNFIAGDTLYNLIKKQGRLSEEKAIEYMKQVGSALSFCHEQGIIHRDVKPLNIMLRSDSGQAVLIDFGIAREAGADTVTTFFSPAFAPWEQIGKACLVDLKGEEEAKKWLTAPTIDIYSCASSLFYLVTGDTPVDPRSNIPLIASECKQEFPEHIPLSEGIKQAIIAGMDPEPGDRPQSIEAWLKLLVPSVTPSASSPKSSKTTPSIQSTPVSIPASPSPSVIPVYNPNYLNDGIIPGLSGSKLVLAPDEKNNNYLWKWY